MLLKMTKSAFGGTLFVKNPVLALIRRSCRTHSPPAGTEVM